MYCYVLSKEWDLVMNQILYFLFIIYNLIMNIQNLSPLCSEKHKAYEICINPKCKAPSFICVNHKIDQQEGCPCQNPHMECEKINWSSIKNKLDKSAIRDQPQFKQFLQKMETVFVQAKARIDESEKQYTKWKQSFGLTDKQSQFVTLIREERTNEVTGLMVYELRKQLKLSPEIVIMSENEIIERLRAIDDRKEKLTEEMSALYNRVTVKKSKQIESPDVSDEGEQMILERTVRVTEKVINYRHLSDSDIKNQLDKINENIESSSKNAIEINKSGITRLAETLTYQLQNLESHVNALEQKLITMDTYSRDCNQKNDQVLTKITQLENACMDNQTILVNKIDGIEANCVNNNQILGERINQIETTNNTKHIEIMRKMDHMERHCEENKEQLASDVRQRISAVSDQLGNRITQQSEELIQRIQQIERHCEQQKQQMLNQVQEKINLIKTGILSNFENLSTAQDKRRNDIMNNINNVKTELENKINTLRIDLAKEIKETDVRVIRGVQQEVKKQIIASSSIKQQVQPSSPTKVEPKVEPKIETPKVQTVPQPIKLKKQYLDDLNTQLQKVQGKPVNLELKCKLIMQSSDVSLQFILESTIICNQGILFYNIDVNMIQ